MTGPTPARHRPTPEQLAAAVGGTMDDLLSPGLRLLVVGVNPSPWTAAVNAPFARPGNRFWPALHAAGITPYAVDASTGLTDEDRAMLAERGVGVTNLVARATVRADELSAAELREGTQHVAAVVRRWEPRVVAVLGITAYRAAWRQPRARVGLQPERLAGAVLYVVPNPSGLNAHETTASLAEAYAEVGRAAGIVT